MNRISQTKKEMQEVILVLENELRSVRPGRASADLIATLPVSVYGGNMPLNQLASTSANEQAQLLITPWDKSSLGAIEKAVRDSQLGFSVVNEGTQLRLSVPPMSQERRQEFVKLVNQKEEVARIRLRQIRTDALQSAGKDKTAGILREDEYTRLEKDLNEQIDDFNKQAKTLAENKEKELLS